MDWLERAQPNVERKFASFSASCPNSIENLRSKVEACGWRRHGTGVFRKYRLVTRAIGDFVVTLDVRRQWNVTERFQERVNFRGHRGSELNGAQSEFPSFQYFAFQFTLAKNDSLADRQLSARSNQGFPCICAQTLSEKNLDSALQVFVRS